MLHQSLAGCAFKAVKKRLDHCFLRSACLHADQTSAECGCPLKQQKDLPHSLFSDRHVYTLHETLAGCGCPFEAAKISALMTPFSTPLSDGEVRAKSSDVEMPTLGSRVPQSNAAGLRKLWTG